MCPIVKAIPDVSVAIFRAPVLLVIYELVPSWYKVISLPAPNSNLSLSGTIKSPLASTVTALDASDVPKVVISK